MAKSASSTGNGGNSTSNNTGNISTAVKGLRAEIENGELVIRVPLNKAPQPSASGKTLVVASSHGNVTTDAQVNGQSVIIGVNAYIKR